MENAGRQQKKQLWWLREDQHELQENAWKCHSHLAAKVLDQALRLRLESRKIARKQAYSYPVERALFSPIDAL